MPYHGIRYKENPMKIDFHVHTPGSDGHGTPKAYAKAAVAAGLDGVVITDHHRSVTKAGQEVAEALRAAGVMVFTGCEYSTADGHCLVIGVDVATLDLGMYPKMQLVIDRANAAGGCVVPSHPFHGYRTEKLGDRVRSLAGITACEMQNGRAAIEFPTENAQACKAGTEAGIVGTGGSDAHYAEDIGTTYTEVDGAITTDVELVAAIRAGRVHPMLNAKIIAKRAAERERVWLEWSKKQPKPAGKGKRDPLLAASYTPSEVRDGFTNWDPIWPDTSTGRW
jgi:predicted metal-dependent phosphoesterase TrpH